jgi:signal transduction histidine kinase
MNKYKDIFDSKKISIETKLEPLKLNVSDKDLERLIEHLTFNAFYYSKPQSNVKITTQNENRLLVIQDEGIGMSRETIEMILKGPFRSKEAIVLNEKGSGIGFQIIKEIVEKLGATLQIESVIGQGTQIIIHF